MKTQILKLSEDIIPTVIECFKRGEVVVFPSDNTYGLFADGSNADAVQKIYELKGRDGSKALGYYIDPQKADRYGKCDQHVKKIIDLWPCPISIIVPKTPHVPDFITRGLSSVLLVCPDRYCVLMNKYSEFPITCTSANLSGQPAVTDFTTAYEIFNGKVPVIVDGGKSKHGQNGTIIDFSRSPATILRVGPYSVENIRAYIHDVVVADKLI